MGQKPKNIATKPDEAIIAEVIGQVTSGKLRSPMKTLAPSTHDWTTLRRITGFDREEWEQRMSERLAELSEKIRDKIAEKLDNDEFKTGELAYALSVTEDKRGALSGRVSLAGASVNVQINNYGTGKSREQIVSELYGAGSNESAESVI